METEPIVASERREREEGKEPDSDDRSHTPASSQTSADAVVQPLGPGEELISAVDVLLMGVVGGQLAVLGGYIPGRQA